MIVKVVSKDDIISPTYVGKAYVIEILLPVNKALDLHKDEIIKKELIDEIVSKISSMEKGDAV
jgi:hypothetical protein